jgi:multisubunit Na+/H+ antiporter MnhC subunit
MKSTNLVLGMAVIALGLHLVKMKTEETKTVDFMLFMLTH